MEKRLNKALIIFTVFVVMLTYGAWEVMRSDFVASYIGRKVSEVLSKQEGLHVSFENLEVNPISFEVKAKNVHVETLNLGGTADELSLSLGFFSFFKSQISLDTITISGGDFTLDLNLGSKKPKSKQEDLNIRDELTKLFDHEALKRFRKVEVKNTVFYMNRDRFKFIDFKIHNFKELKVLAGKVLIRSQLLGELGAPIDGLDISATISRNKITLSPLLILSDIDHLMIKGEVIFNKNGIPIVTGESDFKLSSNKLNKLTTLNMSGLIRGYGKFGGMLSNLESRLTILSDSLDSEYFKLKEVEAEIGLFNKNIVINRFSSKIGSGRVSISKAYDIFNGSKKEVNLKRIPLKLHKVRSKELLFFLEDSLGMMNLTLNGDTFLSYNIDREFLKIDVQNGFSLPLVQLVSDKPIIDIQKLEFKSGNVDVDIKNDKVALNFSTKNKDFLMILKGEVGPDKGTRFTLEGENIDLGKVRDIAGVKVDGIGKLNLDIKSKDETTIGIDLDMDEFSIVDLKLGDSVGNAFYNIDTGLISISELSSKINQSTAEISGSYDIPSGILLIDGNHSKSDVKDFLHIFNYYLELPQDIISSLSGELSTSYKLAGPIDTQKLKVSLDMSSNLLAFKDINLDTIKASVLMNEGILKLRKFQSNLFGGNLTGRYEYHFLNGYQDIEFLLTKASLSSVSYLPKLSNPIKGSLSVEGFGAGKPEDFSLKVGVDVNDLNVSNELYKYNYVDLVWDASKLDVDVDFFNSQLISKSQLNFKQGKSYVKTDVNFENLNPFFYAINSNLKNRQSSLRSRLGLTMNVVADLPNNQVESVDLNILDFYLRHYANTMTHKKTRSRLLYENGLIKEGRLELLGTRKSIVYELEEIKRLVFKNRFEIDLPLTFLELVVPFTEFNSGRVKGNVSYFSGYENYFDSGDFEISNLAFQPQSVPVNFEKFGGRVTLKDRRINIEKIEGLVGKGKFHLSGGVNLENFIPEVDVLFNLQNSLITPFENSKFLISAEGAIKGQRLPYLIDGKIIVYHAEINESIDKLTSDLGGNLTKSKYLPSLKISKRSQFLRTKFFLEFIKPLQISNDLFTFNLLGSGTVLGDIDEIKFDGQFKAAQKEENIIIVKGHRFRINEAVANLKEDDNDSTLLVKGSTRIKDYEIFLNVDGPLKKIEVTLTSEPSLPKEDIFSLITFGYTTQTSQELDPEERDSIATVGIGSLIFDQLKIGQGLNSSLGLKMSISPEFQTEEGSLLEGKSAVSTSRRLRSATRIKLEKSFSDKVDMSFSNTVGGSVQQKQEMNVIYKVNDNISVDGVLEVREVTDESSESPESIGADLKYKWSF